MVKKLSPSIHTFDTSSKWYVHVRCVNVHQNSSGFVEIVGPKNNPFIGKKIYVPRGYLSVAGACYESYVKIQMPNVPKALQKLICVLPSLTNLPDDSVEEAEKTMWPKPTATGSPPPASPVKTSVTAGQPAAGPAAASTSNQQPQTEANAATSKKEKDKSPAPSQEEATPPRKEAEDTDNDNDDQKDATE